MNTTISNITERGQITLPQRVRTTGAFKNARAVEFVVQGSTVLVRPIVVRKTGTDDDHLQLVDHTMRDWLDSAHDNLFDVS
jgi:bifunctional DNA-binding transcriptional regulator/antitoxin component of YhaV-PrlF toxin-antitoxin module